MLFRLEYSLLLQGSSIQFNLHFSHQMGTMDTFHNTSVIIGFKKLEIKYGWKNSLKEWSKSGFKDLVRLIHIKALMTNNGSTIAHSVALG